MTDTEQFPWWEDRRKEGFFQWIVVPARPLLILALFIGAYFFLFERPQNVPERSPGSTALSGFTDEPLLDTEGEGGNIQSLSGIPPQSLLASLFGENAVDPLFSVPSQRKSSPTKPVISPTQFAPESVPEKEPERSVWLYLVGSSEIGFKANASRLGLALATADQGDPESLDVFIADLEQKTLVLAGLVPPAEIQRQHDASLKLLERYIALLRAARDERDGSVQTTWDSDERKAIAEEAARINGEIRDIVHTYQIVLPRGVLP